MLKVTAPVNVVLPQEIAVEKVAKKTEGPPIKYGPIPDKKHRDPNVTYIHTTPGEGSKKPGRTIVIKGEAYPLRAPSSLEGRCKELFHNMLGRPCTSKDGNRSRFFNCSSMGVYKTVASGSGEYGRKSLV